ncbi:MAG: YdjY domain-containing protein [Planctomycetota bacterium]|jgi:beta-lactamase regulating signal transducer with metallopeptidase domain
MSWPSEAFAELALRQLWQVTLVILIVAAVVRLACRRRPHVAHVLWLVVVLKCLTPPIWSSPTGLFSWLGLGSSPAAATIPSGPTGREPAAGNPTWPSTIPRFVPPRNDSETAPAGQLRPDAAAGPLIAPSAAGEPEPLAWLGAALLAVWLSGVVILAVVLAGGSFWCLRLVRRSRVATEEAVDRLVAALSKRLGVRRKVRVLVTSRCFGPAVCGVLRPTLVLPQALVSTCRPDHLEWIVAHELIHVRRSDGLVGMLQIIAGVVWWFHPLVWWANRQMCRQREHCCDEQVVAGLRCDPGRYAQSLLDVLKLRCRWRPAFGLPAVRAAQITSKRLERIMDRQKVFHRRTPAVGWLVLITSGLFLLPGAGIARMAEETDASPPAEAARGEPAAAESPKPAENHAADKQEAADAEGIGPAVARAVAYLKHRQRADGSWAERPGFDGGITALCTLALLKSGVPAEDESVGKAMEYLARIEPERTYVVALQTMVFCAAGPLKHRATIVRNVRWLEKAQITKGPARGSWSYPILNITGDNSNSQYAIMALHEAERVGVEVSEQTWRLAADYWRRVQNADGSWGYVGGIPGTGTMTCAGIASLVIADSHLTGEGERPENAAVARAIEWLAKNFSAESNPGAPGNYLFSYLHGMSRAARLTARKTLGDHDWYAEGVKTLMAHQDAQGSWQGENPVETDPRIATSFALLFLARSSGPAADPGPERPLVDDPARLHRLHPKHPVWLSQDRKSVVFLAEVCQREAALETFACLRGSKEHESVVSVDSAAYVIHAGLMAVGAEPGSPVQFHPEYARAQGPEVAVTVVWEDDRGRRHRARAQRWVREVETGQALEHPWVFAGSRFVEDRQAGRPRYQADREGVLIGVSNFPGAVLDVPIRSSDSNAALRFETFTEQIPPVGTPVTVVLTPKPPGARSARPRPPGSLTAES